jgi:hypothetical protein
MTEFYSAGAPGDDPADAPADAPVGVPVGASINDEVLIERVVRTIGGVTGVRAIVLGGSRARGEASEKSDYDIGLYYEPNSPIDTGALGRAIATMQGPVTSQVTAIGEWGPWINGGAWLTVAGKRVDLLYRDLAKVRGVIATCRAGRIERAYQPGHPHGFVSAIYMGELALAKVLWDPDQALMPPRRQCDPYPEVLGEALIRSFFWEARFAVENAEHGRGLTDPNYVAGCIFRAVACLCQSLFALNRVYLLNEKGAVQGVGKLKRHPPGFADRVAEIHCLGAAGLPALYGLIDDVEALLKA